MPLFQDLLSHALSADVPDSFLKHLVKHRANWDDTFTRHLDELAYEIRPDLATWEITINQQGKLSEQRMPLVEEILEL